MPKLNQINAIVSARKNEAEKHITELYKLIQKDTLFVGRERTYRPLDEVNGQKLPPESQRVQQRADDLVRQAREKWIELWNLVLTQDTGNQAARADVVVDVALHHPATAKLRQPLTISELARDAELVTLPIRGDPRIDPHRHRRASVSKSHSGNIQEHSPGRASSRPTLAATPRSYDSR